MPPLTLTAKEHWQERLTRRITKKIEAVVAADPGLPDRLRQEARRRALQSLGLAEMQAELDDVAARQEELERRARQAHRAMLAVVRGVPLEEVTDAPGGGLPAEVAAAVRRRQVVHEEELLAEDPQGREILRLRHEREGLPDAVWLATAPPEIKDLWRKLIELLGEEPTALQKEALPAGAAAPDG